jgi:hypothetical protein
MEITTVEQPDGTGRWFDARDLALGLSAARLLTNRVSVGGSVHYLQQRIWHQQATGWAVDLASLYRIAEKGFSVGMVVTNFGPALSMDDGPLNTYVDDPPSDYPGGPDRYVEHIMKEFQLPLTFKLGVSARLLGKNSLWRPSLLHQLTLLAAVDDAFDAPLHAQAGAEYIWNRFFILRGGYRFNYDAAGISLGGGLLWRLYSGMLLHLDYAWLSQGDLGDSSVWSLQLNYQLERHSQ